MLAAIPATVRDAFADLYDLGDEELVVRNRPPTPPTPPAPAPTSAKREIKPRPPNFWKGVRKATATTKAEPWEFLSAELGAIFDTRNAKWKEQYYRLWCKHHYPQDKGRWVRREPHHDHEGCPA